MNIRLRGGCRFKIVKLGCSRPHDDLRTEYLLYCAAGLASDPSPRFLVRINSCRINVMVFSTQISKINNKSEANEALTNGNDLLHQATPERMAKATVFAATESSFANGF